MTIQEILNTEKPFFYTPIPSYTEDKVISMLKLQRKELLKKYSNLNYESNGCDCGQRWDTNQNLNKKL